MSARWKTLGLGLLLALGTILAAPVARADKDADETRPAAKAKPASPAQAPVLPRAPGVTAKDAKSAQSWLERTYAWLDKDLGHIADSFDHDVEQDLVQVETNLFHVEKMAVDLILAAETAGLDDWSRSVYQNKVRTKLRSVFRLRQITQAVTMERLDKYLPGEPGVERRYDGATGMTEYQPLFRMGTPKPGQPVLKPAHALYGMVRGFLDAGNKFSDIKPLTRGTLRGMSETADLIWAQDAVRSEKSDNHVKMATYVAPDRKGVKHPVVAMGPKKAREFLARVESGQLDLDSEEAAGYVPQIPGAGTFQVMRAPDGQHFALVPVTNKTGNFKAGAATMYAFQQALEDVGVNADAIIEHTSEVGRPEILKLLLKAEVARGAITKADADTYLERHTALAARPLKRPVAFDRIRRTVDAQVAATNAALRSERSRDHSVARTARIGGGSAFGTTRAGVKVGGGAPRLPPVPKLAAVPPVNARGGR